MGGGYGRRGAGAEVGAVEGWGNGEMGGGVGEFGPRVYEVEGGEAVGDGVVDGGA